MSRSHRRSCSLLYLRVKPVHSYTYIKPVTYLRVLGNDRILLDQDDKKFTMYDLVGERVEDADYSRRFGIMKSIVCVESLVGLDELEGHNGLKKRGESESKLKFKIESESEEEEDD